MTNPQENTALPRSVRGSAVSAIDPVLGEGPRYSPLPFPPTTSKHTPPPSPGVLERFLIVDTDFAEDRASRQVRILPAPAPWYISPSLAAARTAGEVTHHRGAKKFALTDDRWLCHSPHPDCTWRCSHQPGQGGPVRETACEQPELGKILASHKRYGGVKLSCLTATLSGFPCQNLSAPGSFP